MFHDICDINLIWLMKGENQSSFETVNTDFAFMYLQYMGAVFLIFINDNNNNNNSNICFNAIITASRSWSSSILLTEVFLECKKTRIFLT